MPTITTLSQKPTRQPQARNCSSLSDSDKVISTAVASRLPSGTAACGPHGCANNHYVHQPELEAVLRQGLARFDHVGLHVRHEVTGWSAAPDGGACLDVSGPDGAARWQARASKKPGSLMPGVPASEMSARVAPLASSSTTRSTTACSLWAWKARKGVLMP